MKKTIIVIVTLLFVLTACQQNTTPTYKIHFDANGGTGAMSFQYFNTYTEITLDKNTFVYTGNSFIGWDMDGDESTIEYTDEAQFSDTFSGAKTNITLKAVWENGYRITFDANGGMGTMESQLILENSDKFEEPLIANTFIKPGYSFSGWSELQHNAIILHTDEATYTATKQTTLYAQWLKLN